MMLPPIYVIAGATATGKSARALAIAKRTGGTIINADSQQLYRELRVLTARPSAEEEAQAPHKLYGLFGADDDVTVAKWLTYAVMEINWVRSQGAPAIVVGGTGLYLHALINGLSEIPEVSADIKAQVQQDFERMGRAAFFERLQAVDALTAARIDAQNPHRLMRAYSVWLATAKPLSYWQSQGLKAHFPREAFTIDYLQLPRDELYARCNARFDTMMNNGAIDEVERLGVPTPEPLQRSIGVKELRAYLDGQTTLEDAVEKAKQATRNYAKRQITWFNKYL